MTDTHTLREEKFILAYGSSLQSARSKAKVGWWKDMVGEKVPVHGSQEAEKEGPARDRNTCFQFMLPMTTSNQAPFFNSAFSSSSMAESTEYSTLVILFHT